VDLTDFFDSDAGDQQLTNWILTEDMAVAEDVRTLVTPPIAYFNYIKAKLIKVRLSYSSIEDYKKQSQRKKKEKIGKKTEDELRKKFYGSDAESNASENEDEVQLVQKKTLSPKAKKTPQKSSASASNESARSNNPTLEKSSKKSSEKAKKSPDLPQVALAKRASQNKEKSTKIRVQPASAEIEESGDQSSRRSSRAKNKSDIIKEPTPAPKNGKSAPSNTNEKNSNKRSASDIQISGSPQKKKPKYEEASPFDESEE
jgi:hypothetical protein